MTAALRVDGGRLTRQLIEEDASEYVFACCVTVVTAGPRLEQELSSSGSRPVRGGSGAVEPLIFAGRCYVGRTVKGAMRTRNLYF